MFTVRSRRSTFVARFRPKIDCVNENTAHADNFHYYLILAFDFLWWRRIPLYTRARIRRQPCARYPPNSFKRKGLVGPVVPRFRRAPWTAAGATRQRCCLLGKRSARPRGLTLNNYRVRPRAGAYCCNRLYAFCTARSFPASCPV